MMDFAKLKKLTIGGVELKQLFINGIQVWKTGYKNWVKHSTESDGVTIYNGGLGYKDGYRVRSGGAETGISIASCTGYIKVSPGDIVRLSGWDFSYASTSNAINAANSGFTNLGQVTSGYSYGIFTGDYADYDHNSITQELTGVWKWVVPPAASGVAYIRVTGYTGGDGSKMVVTINEEIT